MIKANFKISKPSKMDEGKKELPKDDNKKDLSKEEFEEFISKSGAAGSFMIFRSDKKETELGLYEL